MKKFDFKNINWKDPKFIFPLVIFFPVLGIGYMMFGIVNDLSSSDTTAMDSIQKQQIADVPVGDSLSIESKSDAILEAFKNQQDFTAVQLANESTRIQSDTTLYSKSEQELIDQQFQAQQENLKRQQELNELIQDHNTSLAESRRGSSERRGGSSSSSSDLDKEIRMYQKILRGEEPLTEEEEEQRKISRIRKEEGDEIEVTIKGPNNTIVEKVSNSTNSAAFNTVKTHKEETNYIRAMVDQGVTVTLGSRIRFRLLDDVRIQGVTVPAGTHIYALVSSLDEQRVKANVTSIITKDRRVKVNLSVYDRDGIEGFFIPKSGFRDLKKEASSQALGQNNINFNSSAESIEGVALQTLQGVYQSASNAISNKIKENKAKIKYNTTIYLINDNE